MSSELMRGKQQRNAHHRVIYLFALLFGITWCPTNLSAQIGLEPLLGGVTDVSLYGSCWQTRSDVLRDTSCPTSNLGFGVEVLWGLKTFRFGEGADSAITWKLTGKTEAVKKVPSGVTVDSTLTYKPEVSFENDRRLSMDVELALGYGQFSGLKSSSTAYELRGTVREAPAVALYLSFENGPFPSFETPLFPVGFSPYIGFRSGLIQLQNAQLIVPIAAGVDSAVVYTGAAQAFQVGGALGLAVEFGRITVFSEFAYNSRRFASVQWGALPGSTRMLKNVSRDLDFTGSTFSVGLQVPLRDPSK